MNAKKKGQINTLKTSHVAENGRTAIPTNKSATAKLTMKKLVTFLNLCEQKTAAITRQLPTITNTLMNANTASDIKFPGSVHLTESMSVQLFIAFLSPDDRFNFRCLNLLSQHGTAIHSTHTWRN